jgi:hypothetical protein
MRLEVQGAEKKRQVITVAHDPAGVQGAMLLDIDCIVMNAIAPVWKGINTTIEELHEDIWVVFESAKGPALDRLLRGAKP